VPVVLTAPVRSREGVREFRPARVTRNSGGVYTAEPLPGGEAFLTGYATANALLAIPEAASDVATGVEVPALLLDGGVE
jgi:molybdopterin molybdotransferase